MACACLHLKNLKRPLNDFSCEANTRGLRVSHLQKTLFLVKAAWSGLRYTPRNSVLTQPYKASRAVHLGFSAVSSCVAILLPESQLSSAFCDPGSFPAEKALENLVCYSPTPVFFCTNGTQSNSLLDFLNLILAVGKLYLVSFWFGWKLPLLQLTNKRLVLGCLLPISVGKVFRVGCYTPWCRKEERYILQFSFHYRLEGCDVFPLSFLEIEVLTSACHWEKCLTVFQSCFGVSIQTWTDQSFLGFLPMLDITLAIKTT